MLPRASGADAKSRSFKSSSWEICKETTRPASASNHFSASVDFLVCAWEVPGKVAAQREKTIAEQQIDHAAANLSRAGINDPVVPA